MVRIQGFVAALLAALVLVVPGAVRAGEATQAEVDALKKEVEQIRKQLSGPSTAIPKSPVDEAVKGKYGPNATVTTKNGKLKIEGLVQIWYYSIQNDNKGMFDNLNGTGIVDTNEASDNDSFAVRRTELTFNMDIHENVQAIIRIDPPRENRGIPNLPDNKGLFKGWNNVAPEYNAVNGPGLGSTATVSAVQTGAGRVPGLLKDAYIRYHGVVPHHDFQIGQFRPQVGEEGPRSSAELDFVERSEIGKISEDRDLGIQMHGFWWDDRLQYWLGAFDGAGNYFGGYPTHPNRSDDNDYKDFLASVMVRPLWKSETWGSIELGYAFMAGKHGESGGRDPIATPLNGLNRCETFAMKHGAYGSYMPGGPVKGWWMRGEFLWMKDRNAPGTVVDILANGGTDLGNTDSGTGLAQSNPAPIHTSGWYVATGYKLSDSIFADKAPSWLKPWEFAFRYQAMGNVMVADQSLNSRTDIFQTKILTAGINYYIKGNNAKIQANYNWVNDPNEGRLEKSYGFREVRNDNFIVNFQVAF
ncbi:MAG: porin [Planctomycetota bacterium]|nr:porin [Planctomycetota bacterium]